MRVGVVLWVGLAIVSAVHALAGASVAVLEAMTALAVLLFAAAWRQPLMLGVVLAVVGWALVTGFVVHTGGELMPVHRWDAVRLVRLLVVAAAAAIPAAVRTGPTSHGT